LLNFFKKTAKNRYFLKNRGVENLWKTRGKPVEKFFGAPCRPLKFCLNIKRKNEKKQKN
jgi:hypothetical protein